MQFAKNLPETANAQIGFAAIALLAPNCNARDLNSSPNTKLKLSIDENIPEKIQMTRPIVKSERLLSLVPASRSRARPAKLNRISPSAITSVPVMSAMPRFVVS